MTRLGYFYDNSLMCEGFLVFFLGVVLNEDRLLGAPQQIGLIHSYFVLISSRFER